MDITAGMIIMAGFGSWLSARHRAAVPALVLGVIAVVLFCTTPLGSGLPGALGTVIHGVSSVGATVADAGHSGGSR
jgi:hypothetical protein